MEGKPTRGTEGAEKLLAQRLRGVGGGKKRAVQVVEGNHVLHFGRNTIQTGLEVRSISDRHAEHISLQLGDLSVLVVQTSLLQKRLHSLQLRISVAPQPHLFRFTDKQHTLLLRLRFLLLLHPRTFLATRHSVHETLRRRRSQTRQLHGTLNRLVEVWHPEEHAAATQHIECGDHTLHSEAREDGFRRGGSGKGCEGGSEVAELEGVIGVGEEEEERMEGVAVGAHEKEVVGLKSCALIVSGGGKMYAWIHDRVEKGSFLRGDGQPLSLRALEEEGLSRRVYLSRKRVVGTVAEER